MSLLDLARQKHKTAKQLKLEQKKQRKELNQRVTDLLNSDPEFVRKVKELDEFFKYEAKIDPSRKSRLVKLKIETLGRYLYPEVEYYTGWSRKYTGVGFQTVLRGTRQASIYIIVTKKGTLTFQEVDPAYDFNVFKKYTEEKLEVAKLAMECADISYRYFEGYLKKEEI